MNRPLALALLPLLLVLGAGAPADADDTGMVETLLLQQPTVSKDHVVFVYAQDLWIAPRAGGDARRLTSHVGRETAPRLSPDGRYVAFSGFYEGNMDVYVIPVDGGSPRRLTWHPGQDVVRGWHPDGKRVLFSSGRASGRSSYQLYHVDVAGGVPARLPLPKVGHAAWNDAGDRIAYTPIWDAFRTWKRYRGGRTPPVWIYDPKTHDVEVVPHVNASDTFPCWVGKDVYFASDRTGQMNIFRYRPGSKQVEQITRFKDIGVRNMTSGAGVLAFTVAGSIRIYDPATKRFQKLKIRVRTDGLMRNPSWRSARGFVRSASISPSGNRAVFEARGEIITVPREHGAARNISKSPGVNDREPSWSPDGASIAWFSDASGEYQLVVRDRRGREEAKSYDLGGAGFYHDPVWSPDGKHIIFSDKANRLAYITLETGKVTTISQTQGSLGVWRPFGFWSPDGKWIAFEKKNPETTYNSVGLFEVATGKVTRLTDGFSTADSPAFSSDGKYLFFRASVNSGPKSFGLDMSTSAARPTSSRLYVVVLKKDGKNPLEARSDEEKPKPKKKAKQPKPDGDKKKAEGDEPKKAKDDGKGKDAKKEEKKPEKPSIDVEDIDQRILALPVGSGRYWGLTCVKDRLLFIDRPLSGGMNLKSFDFKSRKARDVASGVMSVKVAAGGKHLLLRKGSRWQITNDSGSGAKTPAIDNVKVRVVPELEWPQILRETWRLQRDYFYDEQMHQIDWDAMWERWSAFLPHVQHRAELTILQQEMMGELACGHMYVSGGDMPKAPSGISVGLLGADYEVDAARHKIAKIYKGQNWNPGLRAPLTEPGVKARVGDYLISVNGRPISGEENLYAAFEGTAGQRVELELSKTADGKKSWTTTVVPLSSDGRLRQKDWIEANRRRVDELSGGRLAYVYMPNTGGSGMAAFDRDYYSQLDKEGLVLDERDNGGGKVADYVIEVLEREVMCYWMNREKWLSRTPFGTLEGPKVMVINEYAGSGGDCMPWMFRKRGIGPLVGTRTWGGLVGVSGYPPLMDGGSVTAASFGIMDTDGNWVVENEGVAPDHEVIEWPKDIIEGRDPQLEKAVELALEALEKQPKRERPGYTPPKAR
ncbi:MAG: PDZ domain-containing protein [Planctomycetota bacterium]|nr:PDZ domain-containing protein [Planctomycetota bacterium]